MYCFYKIVTRKTMSPLLKLFIIIFMHENLVQCIIPNLIVRKVDKRIIDQKRQDTLEMCKIFTLENKKIKSPNDYRSSLPSTRIKREVNFAVNPALNKEDHRRVEDIVDKLYDDMEDRGEKVVYMHQNIGDTDKHFFKNTKAEIANKESKSGRRFNFAPAELLGPLPEEVKTMKEEEEQLHENKDRPRFIHGIVPYFIDSKSYDAHLSDIITKAFDYFEKATCIRLQKLRERPTDVESLKNAVWLYITNPAGIRQCVHSNERNQEKGVQLVVFGYDCISTGDISHEMMHILGFSHEHTRPDRDQHITILWDNIKPGYRKFFEVRSKDLSQSLPYDYASVLHYPSRAFSRNGQVTILTESRFKIGQREGLSEIDVEKISLVYSSECVARNRDYLLKTCPSVVRSDARTENVTTKDIDHYFSGRLWVYGIVNYRLRDPVEFSTEEKENIKAVIAHIEKETCVQFRDITAQQEESDYNEETVKETRSEKEKESKEDVSQDTAIEDGKLSHNKTKLFAEKLMGNFESENEIGSKEDRAKLRTNGEGEESNYKSVSKNQKPKVSHRRSSTPTSSRRHAASILTLTRSPEPGCICPPPGKPDGDKVLQINTDCFNSVNDLLHLFTHVLGFDHQHNMYDRDAYLHIVWDQLTDDIKKDLKQKLPPAASLGFPYDYQSVMHYPWLQIKNGVTNIMYPIWNDGWAMGHWQGLSSTDVQKINVLYSDQCTQRKSQEFQQYII